jgi:hypothetical protein
LDSGTVAGRWEFVRLSNLWSEALVLELIA